MGLDKRRPRRLSLPVRRGLDSVLFENIADRRVGDVITDVGQGPLDPVVTPGRILLGLAKDQIDDDLADSRATWLLLLPIGVILLLRHQHPVPSQYRIGREQRANLFEHFASKDLAFDCQTPALVVVEQHAFRTEFLFEHLILGAEVFDHFLLLAVDPARDDHDIELPRS